MNQMTLLQQKLASLGCACLREEPMSRHTSFRIGGPAELYLTPGSREQTAAAIAACRELEIPFFLMGNGSNLLVSDAGLRGAVIAFSHPMSRIVRSRSENTLTAEAGATLSQLCRFAQKEGLSGLEFAWGIPGSVGGAVRMNAGAYGGEMKDVVTRVEALSPEGEPLSIPAEQACFGYRSSRFEAGEIVCGATFALTPGDPKEIESVMAQTLQRRVEKQPLDYPSAGSAFRRPPGQFAAALIDQCGLKGFSVGGAQVSEKHAGFVINTGGATCRDVRALLEQVCAEVQRQTGILLEPEIQFLGC